MESSRKSSLTTFKKIEDMVSFDMECFSTIQHIYTKLKESSKIIELSGLLGKLLDEEITTIIKGKLMRT